MVLSKLLGQLGENPGMMDDAFFCEIVLAAWEDFYATFFHLYTNDRGNRLYGWKGKVEGVWDNTIQLLGPDGKRGLSVEYIKRIAWADFALEVACVEKRILAQMESMERLRLSER